MSSHASELRIAVLVARNYWTSDPRPGNGPFYRSLPRIQAALRESGAEPVLVHPGTPSLGDCAGVVLPGGGDLHPGFYGQQVGAALNPSELDPELDRFQLGWARRAMAAGMPVLGICRGLQVMNVAAGGSLIQDLPSLGGRLEHAPRSVLQDPAQRGEGCHAVELQGGSRLADLLGTSPLKVNSVHHQSVDRLGRGLGVTARAEDGTVEALESLDHPFQVGVQFHPEDLREQPRFQWLFTRLVEEAGRYSSSSATVKLP